MAGRDDCWSEDATHTLIEAWGTRFLEMNRGNLRHTDWQEISRSVNSAHGRCDKTSRSEIQCKNRIDTVKKRFKAEKKKIDESNDVSKSSWRFYSRVEFLMGSNLRNSNRNAPWLSVSPPPGFPPLPWYQQSGAMVPFECRKEPEVPLVIGKGKEPMETSFPSVVPSGSGLNRNYSVMAAAAAAEEREVAEEDKEDGLKSLAKAIEGFGAVYQRVEKMKMKNMVELEKVRMKFAKDLEQQRMKMFMDMQVELEKTRCKRVKRGGSADGTLEEFLHRAWGRSDDGMAGSSRYLKTTGEANLSVEHRFKVLGDKEHRITVVF